MALFSRFRQATKPAAEPAGEPHPLLPHVNQRVTIWAEGRAPEPSRVEDETADSIVIAAPSLQLEDGEPVSLTWEGEDGYFRLETTAVGGRGGISLPTITVSSRGQLQRFDERKRQLRRKVELDLSLRVVMSRGLRPGIELQTKTSEIGDHALTFETTAPLELSDQLEAKLALPDSTSISMRLKIMRVDVTRGGIRHECSAVYDDILRSDRSRIAAYLESFETSVQ
jgi:hypothetical protein